MSNVGAIQFLSNGKAEIRDCRPESALADIPPFSSAAAEEKPTELKADYDDRRVEYHVP